MKQEDREAIEEQIERLNALLVKFYGQIHPAAAREREYDAAVLQEAFSRLALVPDAEGGTVRGWRELSNLARAARVAKEHLQVPASFGAESFGPAIAWLAGLEADAQAAVDLHGADGTREYAPGEWSQLVVTLQAHLEDLPG